MCPLIETYILDMYNVTFLRFLLFKDTKPQFDLSHIRLCEGQTVVLTARLKPCVILPFIIKLLASFVQFACIWDLASVHF